MSHAISKKNNTIQTALPEDENENEHNNDAIRNRIRNKG